MNVRIAIISYLQGSVKMEFILNFELMVCSGILILVFMVIDLFITSHFREKLWKSEMGQTIKSLRMMDFENTSQLMKLDYELEKAQKEKDSLVRVIDENLLKGYHEQSLKHKEAKEKMEREDERMEASALIDAVFYWNGYIKALEELKERVSDE